MTDEQMEMASEVRDTYGFDVVSISCRCGAESNGALPQVGRPERIAVVSCGFCVPEGNAASEKIREMRRARTSEPI